MASEDVTINVVGNIKGLSSALSNAKSLTSASAAKIGAVAGAVGSVVSSGLSLAGKAIGGMSSDFSDASSAWQTFDGNMQQLNMPDSKIKSTKKELQDFAQASIYSASDMSSTYSQLAAVGIKNTDKLVTGFGGLASAATDPQQAMKTLSQQATQMAAKPMVQWQDFKLMLEQTPAGVSAVAKSMGMSTSQLVTAVQNGTVKTNDFFAAIEKVGNSPTFAKMATQYKTVGQATDGLKETVTNGLMPAYQHMSGVAITAISGITNMIASHFGTINNWLIHAFDGGVAGATKLYNAVKPFIGPALSTAGNLISTAFGHIGDVFNVIKPAIGPVVNMLGKLSGAGFTLITAALKALMPYLDDAVNALGKMADWLSAKIPSAINTFNKAISTAFDFVGEVFNIIKPAIGPVVNMLVKLSGAGFTLITAALKALMPYLDDAVNTLGKMADWLSAKIPAAIGPVVNTLGKLSGAGFTLITAALKALMPYLDDAVNALGKMADWLSAKIPAAINTFNKAIPGLVANAKMAGSQITKALSGGGFKKKNGDSADNGIKSMIDGIVKGFQGLWTAVAPSLKSFMAALMPFINSIGNVLGPVIQILGSVIGGFLEGVMDMLTPVLKFLTPIFNWIGGVLKTFVPALSVVGRIAGYVLSLLLPLGNVVKIVGKGFEFAGGILSHFGVVGNVVGSVVSHIGSLMSGIGGIAGKMGGWFGGLFTKLTGFAYKIPAVIGKALLAITSIGGNLVKGLWEGVSGMWNWIKDKFKGFGGWIVNLFKKIFGIHSPSRVMAGLGSYMSQGFANGITGGFKYVKRSVSDMSNLVTGSVGNVSVNGAGVSTSTATGNAETSPLFYVNNEIVGPKINTQIKTYNAQDARNRKFAL